MSERWRLETDQWRDYVAADAGPETLILADVQRWEGREVCLYQWHPDSYILTNATYYGRVGRFRNLQDAKRFLVECLHGTILEEVSV